MKLFTAILLTSSILALGGCHHYHHPHGGDFCPPGQAKKGNC